MKDTYLCIHGHFYQPPRENPWLEEIEFQDSAAPYHDWNERIYYECYLPNAMARVLDNKARILDVANNYEKINFNFGPTLMAWLRSRHPGTYDRILEADRESAAAHGGHGNAIAQIYNHVIMPLANRRDKITQVRWGIRDFRAHFKRDPESVWLSETAVDEETLEVLADEGVRYLILEPQQAQAVRPLAGGEHAHWEDVSSGSIDPKFAYRCFIGSGRSRFIDIFFYDGPVSKEIGFGSLAFEARMFADHLERARVDSIHGPQLIHVATDGETYGHHKGFGERALAFLLNIEAPKRGFKLTNYGEYLEIAPPQREVRIKEGGTSWSCAHGVRRWKEHCGCNGGGPEEWTQHWRKPLREALDWLRDQMAAVYEREGKKYFRDVWEARNEYISVMLDRSEKSIRNFLQNACGRILDGPDRVQALKLLEMQRQAMQMYTNCGWFFSEISGLESSMVLRFAVRALEFAEETGGVTLEKEFLERLAKAKSNLPAYRDGKGVYEQLVVPRRVTCPHIAAYYAITTVLGKEQELPRKDLHYYCFDLEVMSQRRESSGEIVANVGRLRVRSHITGEEHDYVYAALHIGLYDFRCWIKDYSKELDPRKLEAEVLDKLQATETGKMVKHIEKVFGARHYGLKDLPLEQRMQVISVLTKGMLARISDVYERLYDENWKMSEIYRAISLPIPPEIRHAVRFTLSRRLIAALTDLARHQFDFERTSFVLRIFEIARLFEVKLETEEATIFLSMELARRSKALLENVREPLVRECFAIYKIAEKIGVELHTRPPQDNLVALFKKWRDNPGSIPKMSTETWLELFHLASLLQIHAEGFRREIEGAMQGKLSV